MLKIDEITEPSGALAAVTLSVRHRAALDGETTSSQLPIEELALSVGETTLGVPGGALEAIMHRYGAPLDETEPVIDMGSLDLGHGARLRHVRHLARFDVVARDYVVFGSDSGGSPPLCAPAKIVASALRYLAAR